MTWMSTNRYDAFHTFNSAILGVTESSNCSIMENAFCSQRTTSRGRIPSDVELSTWRILFFNPALPVSRSLAAKSSRWTASRSARRQCHAECNLTSCGGNRATTPYAGISNSLRMTFFPKAPSWQNVLRLLKPIHLFRLDIPFIFALLLRLLKTGFHDVTKHLIHFLNSENFRQLNEQSAPTIS